MFTKIPRVSAFLAVLVGLTSLAQAHPGHDGGHDLTWDYADVAEHMLTSPYHLAVMGAVLALAFVLARRMAKGAKMAESRSTKTVKSA